MKIVDPLRGRVLHYFFRHDMTVPPPEPGDEGVYRTSCGSKVHGRILTAEDEPSKRMCQRCEGLA